MKNIILSSLVILLLVAPASHAGDRTELAIGSVEERRILAALEERKEKLTEQERKLGLKELELKTLESEINNKLDAMKKVRDELDKLLAAKDEEELGRIRDLSKMYEKMDPVKAAALLPTLDRELAVSILGGIKAKVAGKFLNELDPTVASRFTSAYSTIARD